MIPGIGDISGGAGGISASSSASGRSGSIGNTTSFNISGQSRQTDWTTIAMIGGAVLLASVYLMKRK